MGKKLAIKGHPTRGKEVIELLEMIGGENSLIISGCNLSGYEPFNLYYINDNGVINCKYHSLNKDMVILTLEEFSKKYPFKIGDKVIDSYGDALTIKSMSWSADFETMVYDFEDSAIVLAAEDIKIADNKLSGTVVNNSIDSSQFMQLGKTVAVCFNTANYENEVELKLGDYEIVVRDGKTYAVLKKPAYPKTYEECCKVLRISPEFLIKYSVDGSDTERDAPLIRKFIKLKRCRDVYWKIAGEEMGLGKPWEPDWTNLDQLKYCIIVDVGEFITTSKIRGQQILTFPTEEIRDIFYKNFKDLIETCKELL